MEPKTPATPSASHPPPSARRVIHSVAANTTWEGWFSRDGKKIVYVTVGDRLNSQLMTAMANSSISTAT